MGNMDYFAHALALAEQAIPISDPNPRVGALIVDAHGHILGQGHTQQRGGPHAEIMALRDAQAQGHTVRGATMYVTLEPCAHYGRTPPCCDAIIAAGIAHVHIALGDPNPLVAGQGIARMQAAGIRVDMASAQIQAQARDLNVGFMRRMEQGLPWLRLKTAASMDGFTALPNGHSQWITGAAARADGHVWRQRASVVLTGVGTILADDPQLNVRLPNAQHQPHLAIVDSQLRTPLQAQLWQVPNRQVVLYTTQHAPQSNLQALQAQGAVVHVLPANAQGRVPLDGVVSSLAKDHEANEVHVEAGAALNGALLAQGLVQEWLAYTAPVLLGSGKSVAELPVFTDVNQAPRWQVLNSQVLAGGDIRTRLVLA